MIAHKKYLANYTVSVNFLSVSGFEIVDMLQARSRLALVENQLDAGERSELEAADGLFLKHAQEFYAGLVEIADLSELRVRVNALPSHWWWHLDKLVQSCREALAVS